MSTPKTTIGRLAVICYGFLGCSGGILFFNLFLERIITFLAVTMRYFHERRLSRTAAEQRRDSCVSLDDGLEVWKPSVYWVMVFLLIVTIGIALCASIVYTRMENWSFVESIYFCFVAFSTIGFGDFVPNQKTISSDKFGYRVINFLLIVSGCCCIYSLFNVTSIVIKQFLNWLICKLDCSCTCRRRQNSPKFDPIVRKRRNAITPHHIRSYQQNGSQDKTQIATISGSKGRTQATIATGGGGNDVLSDDDSIYNSDDDKDFSMRDLLKSNKVSLAILQKQLYESAHRGEMRSQAILLPSLSKENKDDFKSGAVGPLAIVTKTLGDDGQ